MSLVDGCTDGEPDAGGEKSPWRERKEAYLDHLQHEPEELLLVSCCDKLHNARAILTELMTHGNILFNRFTGKQAGTLWYYRTLVTIFEKRLPGIVAVRELATTATAIERFAN